MYEYQAKVTEIVDGDTIDVTVDVGFDMRRDIRLRLKGVDTAETYGVDHNTQEYQRGVKHTEFVEQWCDDAGDSEWPFIVRTEKKGSFGRYLATIERKTDGKKLTEELKDTFTDVGN
jgi:micrococcal nuclease